MLLAQFQLDKNPFYLQYKNYCEEYIGFYHYHQGIELLIVHRGRGHAVLNQKMYTLEAGSILCLQPFQLHRVHFEVSKDCPYERSVLKFEPTVLVAYIKMFPAVNRFFEHLWKGTLTNQVITADESDEAFILQILSHFFDKHLSQSDTEYYEAASLMTIQILDRIRRLWHENALTENAPIRSERHSEKIMQWIEMNYTAPFDLDILAKELHLSKHHVSHLFSSETGSSITDYLMSRRIRQACWLLNTETTPIEQVGVSVGIPNFSYFCRLFKKITGFSPLQYRSHSFMQK
ncbi:AraC family transcriptional regulator [Paenibacillus radicis (ex Xue et al. 2023)]|uniref:AraC family transcriptional regulator n=1 Tax=Paenibacillus radicis (ex Xue et al. 2023) TaxID=2972489 RepID=A0ABT1YDU1_9BACL|nr:AraC family transcriptional regulator [Paenibacillus radicis (ex Xue et al. 2023)]MCR8631360.1 AraC family transcriptional regulator [Paenibacillus radicis (ex Xue et al. 2023)]